MYHRFGEHAAAATNITLQQFAAHTAELTSGRYSVLPLPEIVAALRDGRPLPDRTVAIPIDDSYLPVSCAACPLLKIVRDQRWERVCKSEKISVVTVLLKQNN